MTRANRTSNEPAKADIQAPARGSKRHASTALLNQIADGPERRGLFDCPMWKTPE